MKKVIKKITDAILKRTVWTILDTDGNLYFVNDYHYVNRLGYLVTKEQFPEGVEIEVKLDTE